MGQDIMIRLYLQGYGRCYEGGVHDLLLCPSTKRVSFTLASITLIVIRPIIRVSWSVSCGALR